MTVIETRSTHETRRVAHLFAKEIVRAPRGRGARVLALQGELGAGKTTFVQGFAHALGVKEKVKSPTFVLMKIYPLKKQNFRHLIHVDCYRLASHRDLVHLGFKEMLKDPNAVILIEWAERIKKILPRDAIHIQFTHTEKSYGRTIIL